MHASNKPRPPVPASLDGLLPAVAAAVLDLWHGRIGNTVRCLPQRRTVAAPVADGWLFGKWRHGCRAAAAAEWQWLHLLPLLGLETPAPVAFLAEGRRSLLVMRGLPGRSMDAWWRLAAADGWLPQLCRYLQREVAPCIRRLHEQRLVYRDLYWFHIYAEDPRRNTRPGWIDVERLLRPRFLWRRWVVKDLAGLLASLPPGIVVPDRELLRFARACLGGGLSAQRGLLLAVVKKARRIRGHRPRFG